MTSSPPETPVSPEVSTTVGAACAATVAADGDAGFSTAMDRIRTPVWVYDTERTRIVAANAAALAMWRATDLADLQGRDMGAEMSPMVRDRLQQFQSDLDRTGADFTEMWTYYPGGMPTTRRMAVSRHRLPDGRMGMLCEALAEIHDTPERLRSAEALLHTPVMITLYDRRGEALYRNPAARGAMMRDQMRLDERFVDQADYHALTTRLAADAEATMVAQVRTPAGPRWHEINARDCADAVDAHPAWLVSETDVTAHKEAEDQIRYLAQHDTLTGLPNRAYLQSEVTRRIAAAEASGARIGLLFIDLDRFKTINDSLGHAHGDILLVEVARRLCAAVREDDLVARLGGDEFLICLELGRGGRRIEPVARRILRALDAPIAVGGRELQASASIGMCRFPDDGRDLDTLMRHADLAMYAAKDQGCNRWVAFTAALKADVEAQMELESSLRRAFERDEFELYYQPRLSIVDNRIIGAEALLRWHHPTRGLILPGTFIPFAEKTGLIDRIGACVIREAALQQRQWASAGHSVNVSVNLSARQFRDPRLKSTIEGIVVETGCDPRRIEIEITESMLIGDDATTADTLQALTALGFSIAIDDFGTGYSNLGTIQRHPIDTLKIDRSFIATLETQPALAELIIGMCRLLDLKTVAEGVETKEQLAWLKARNCHEYQGYLFSPAVPADAFGTLLEQQAERLADDAAGRSPLWDLVPLVKRSGDVEWQRPEPGPSKVRRLGLRSLGGHTLRDPNRPTRA